MSQTDKLILGKIIRYCDDIASTRSTAHLSATNMNRSINMP